ncbi:hypothetical protein G7046_g2805 [Stylonectria norvegica]|nr:hypothetical protein G7046_g2805 [Stylonectria norvegica]
MDPGDAAVGRIVDEPALALLLAMQTTVDEDEPTPEPAPVPEPEESVEPVVASYRCCSWSAMKQQQHHRMGTVDRGDLEDKDVGAKVPTRLIDEADEASHWLRMAHAQRRLEAAAAIWWANRFRLGSGVVGTACEEDARVRWSHSTGGEPWPPRFRAKRLITLKTVLDGDASPLSFASRIFPVEQGLNSRRAVKLQMFGLLCAVVPAAYDTQN